MNDESREVFLGLQLGARLGEYTTPEAVSVDDEHARVEYRHTTAKDELLGPSVLGSVAAVTRALGELPAPPRETDVVAHSPDDEEPLRYQVSRSDIKEARGIAEDAPAEEIREFLSTVLADAERFIDIEGI